jgi:hypothetical protein
MIGVNACKNDKFVTEIISLQRKIHCSANFIFVGNYRI